MRHPHTRPNSIHEELERQLSEVDSFEQLVLDVDQHQLRTNDNVERSVTQEVYHPTLGLIMRLSQTWDVTPLSLKVKVSEEVEPPKEQTHHSLLSSEHNALIDELYTRCRAPQRVVRVKLSLAHLSQLVYLRVEVTQPDLLVVLTCAGDAYPSWFNERERAHQLVHTLVHTRLPIIKFDAQVYPSPTLLSHARLIFISAPEQLKAYHSLSQRSSARKFGAPIPILDLTAIHGPLLSLHELHSALYQRGKLSQRRLRHVYRQHDHLTHDLHHCLGESWQHQQALGLIAQLLHPKELIERLSSLPPRISALFTVARLISMRFYGVQDPMETSLCFDRSAVTELINIRHLVFGRAALYREPVRLALRALVARELLRDAPYLALQSYLAQVFDHPLTPESSQRVCHDQDAHLRHAYLTHAHRRSTRRSLREVMEMRARRRAMMERLVEGGELPQEEEELSPLERLMRISEQEQPPQEHPPQEQETASLEEALSTLSSLNALYLIQGFIVLEGTQPFGLPEVYVEQDKLIQGVGDDTHKLRLSCASQQHQKTEDLDRALSDRIFMWLTGLFNYASKRELSRALSSLAHLTFYEYDDHDGELSSQHAQHTQHTQHTRQATRSTPHRHDDRPMTQDDDRGAPEMCTTLLTLNVIINTPPLKQPDTLPFLPEETAKGRAERQERVKGRCVAWSSLGQLSRALHEPINRGPDRSCAPPSMSQALRLIKLADKVERERPHCAHLLSLSTKLIKTSADKAKELEEDEEDVEESEYGF